ncbi:MAG: hypothetical protein KatS3mg104_3090 [Phycisphaerae bacterium]|nr:MAG: hypothetical protein KatS3mg104_3090 [Phycisphaerae bacterium]
MLSTSFDSRRSSQQPRTVSLSFNGTVGKRYVPFLRRYLKRAIPLIRNAPSDISIALVNDARMSELHLRFMNIPGPTDVLTFELDHNPSSGRCVSGEIVICVPEARRQASRLGHALEHELLLYALHGILHLCGYDDRNRQSYRRMHRTEDRILTAIGIGAVFTRSGTK